MKTSAIIAIIVAVVVVGGACAGVAFSGVLNGGTTGPGGDDPVVPTEPVDPTPTETPTETPTPTPTPTETQMSTFAPMTSSGSSGSSKPSHVHTWDSGVETVAPTCEGAGEMTFTCIDCQQTKTEAIPATGHDYQPKSIMLADDLTTMIGTCYVCSDCGDVKDAVVTGNYNASITNVGGTSYFATIEGANSAAVAGDVVIVKAGSYTLPHTIIDGISIVAEGNVDFTLTQNEGNWYRINTNGAKFIGVTFNEPVCLTGNATFEDCIFSKGTDTWTVNGDTNLINCTIADNGDGTTPGYSLHIDSGDRDAVVTIEDTEFTGGAVAFKNIKSISFTDCDFAGTYSWKYMRAYVPTTLTDCIFTAMKTDGTLATVKAVESAVGAVTLKNTDVEVEYPPLTFEDGDTVTLVGGEYVLDTISSAQSSEPKDVTIKGTKDVVINLTKTVTAANSNVTFEGVTLVYDNDNYEGLQHSNKEVYRDCTIKGTMFLYAPEVVFENCTFEMYNETTEYSVWTYGAKDVTFTGCTFNTHGKAVLVYTEGETHATITLNSCVFNSDSTIAADKAAVEVGSSPYSTATTYTINLNGCTETGFVPNKSESPLWGNKNSMDKDHLNVVIDGADVY